MSDLQISNQSPPPVLEHTRLKKIRTFEVLGSDLDQIGSLVSEESQALGFTCSLGGVLVSAAVTWVTSPPQSSHGQSFLWVITGVTLIGTAWFGFVWRRTAKKRPTLIEKIRSCGDGPQDKGGAEGTKAAPPPPHGVPRPWPLPRQD
jgi:hypothetical protein